MNNLPQDSRHVKLLVAKDSYSHFGLKLGNGRRGRRPSIPENWRFRDVWRAGVLAGCNVGGQNENSCAKEHPPPQRLTCLRTLFETLYDGAHPLRVALDRLQTLEPVRIIEGKT